MRILSLLLFATACGSSRSATLSESALGTYRFTEHVNDASPPIVIEGSVRIAQDTMVVELANAAACVPLRSNDEQFFVRLRCGDVGIAIDRREPVRRTTYAVAATIRVPVRTCVLYQASPTGQRTCARYGTTYEERRATKSGRLQLRRQ